MSDISNLSSFDDSMNDPDYGNPNSPIEVSDFENISEYEELLRKNSKETNNTFGVEADDEVHVIEDSDEEITVRKGKKKTKDINNWKRNRCKKRKTGPD